MDTTKRFESYGWQVLTVEDGNDVQALRKALDDATAETKKPSLIKVRTSIIQKLPNKHDTAGAHGSPLGEEEVKLTKENLGFDLRKFFYVPDEVYDYYKKAVEKNVELSNEWNKKYSEYKNKFPELAAEFENANENKLNLQWIKYFLYLKQMKKALKQERHQEKL